MAAGRINGITVEIGGDTTKLQAALKGVNSEIKNTQSQLKDVEKLLKLDPGNMELLAQKHKLLAQAVSETKEKLETLKTAAEQANTALANGDISQEQYDALQREIIETENELRRLEEAANQSATAVQKIAATGEKLQTLGDNISSAGTKLLPVTASVTAVGTAAVKTAADFDSAMSQVAAVSDATGSDLDALRDKAREMGSKTKLSASEAAEAMNYMAMAGWKTGDMLSGIEGISTTAQTIWNGIKDFFSGLWEGIKTVFTTVVTTISTFLSTVSSVWNGIKSCISAVGNAVSSVANKIRSFLHFSVPDEGPLTDYESWMPDFMKGLAKGIESGKAMVAKAMDGLAADMVVNPMAAMPEVSVSADSGNSGQTPAAGVTIEIKEMSVRSDDDIRRISQQLYRQLQQGRRANGYTSRTRSGMSWSSASR